MSSKRKNKKSGVRKTKRGRKSTMSARERKERREGEYMTIFLHGKQKRVKRPPTIEGLDVDEFIRRNADDLWLHQNEMWEDIEPTEEEDAP